MKKHIALKIVLMLLVFAVACFINNNQASATTYSNVNYSTVARSDHYFCRDYGGPLTSKYITYVTDTSKNGTGIYYTHYNDEYAYIFNFLGKTASTIRGSEAQQAFWSLLGQGGYSWTRFRQGYNNYSSYHSSISSYSNNNPKYSPNIIIPESSEYNPITHKFGPIIVKYATWNGYGLTYSVEANGRTIISERSLSPSNNFYIDFTGQNIDGIREAKLKINYTYLSSCWAKIEPIKSNGSGTSERYFCEYHKNNKLPVKPITQFNEAVGRFTWWEYNDKYYVYYGHNGRSHDSELYGIQGDGCYWIPTGIVYGTSFNRSYGYYRLEPFVCFNDRQNNNVSGNNDMGQDHCGYVVTPSQSQKLVYVTYGKTTGSGSVEKTFTIINVPDFNIEIEKHNSYGATPDTKPTGAVFKAIVKQKGTTIVNDVTMTNGKITISPRTDDPVYALIYEKTAPNGYKKIEPINIRFDYDEANDCWHPNYIINKSTWTNAGFNQSTWSNWSLMSGTQNNYQSASGDVIVNTTRNNSETIKFKAYDKAIIASLTLKKVDADDTSILLNNAKFNATFENVSEFTYNNVKVTPGNKPYEFTINGQFSIKDVVFTNENTPIIITLEEIEVPTRDGQFYIKLDGQIVITISHTSTLLT